MRQDCQLGITNVNGREPSVAEKLRLHRKVVALHRFKTEHRIMLGDSRRMAGVQDETVHLIVTSPPYFDLVTYVDGDSQLGNLHDYQRFLDELDNVWRECMRVLIPGGKMCVVVGDVCRARKRFGKHEVIPLHADLQVRCRTLGLVGLATVFWHKIANATTEVGGRGAALGKPYEPNGVVKNDIEFVLRFKKDGPYRKPTPLQRAASLLPPQEYDAAMRQVWSDIPGASHRNGHPAPFPVSLASRLIRMSSFVEDTVLDPFLGTGSTTQAAIDCDRNSVGVEIAEKYWKMAIQRFSQLSLDSKAAIIFEKS
ncbi:MAG: site-specific DNA-methyltransferase [Deltaproteobacteria bacterium]|nr:site-specific DNA-methyltransferase [Deltaproteobacteria bacterium]